MGARFTWMVLGLALAGCDHPADMKDRDVDGRRAGSPTATPAGERQGDTLGGADSFPSGNSTVAGASGTPASNTLMVMVDPTAKDGRPVEHLVATVHGTPENPKIHGAVHFRRTGDTVSVTSDVQGLPAGEHGYHVHVYGDCSAPASKSMGPHLDFAGLPGAMATTGGTAAAGGTQSSGMTTGAGMTGASGATGNPRDPSGMTTGTPGPSGLINGAGDAATSAGADGTAANGVADNRANGAHGNGGRGAPGADGASSAGDPGPGAISGNPAVDTQPGLRGTTSQSGQPVHPNADKTATAAVQSPAGQGTAGQATTGQAATGQAAAGANPHADHIAGNLGQLTGAATGSAQAQQTVAGLGGGLLGQLVGRAVVIHAGPNDPTKPPDGGAGDPIACGVIGVASGEAAPAVPAL